MLNSIIGFKVSFDFILLEKDTLPDDHTDQSAIQDNYTDQSAMPYGTQHGYLYSTVFDKSRFSRFRGTIS